MTTGDRALTARDGFPFIQPDGANTILYLLECKTVGDITAGLGGLELIQCFDKNGNYITKGSTQAPPEIISASVEGLLTKNPDWLEKLATRGCFFPFYVKQQECGNSADWDNFDRLILLGDTKITSYTYTGLVTRDEDTVSMYNVDLEILPPATVSFNLTVSKMTSANANQANDIVFNTDEECDNDCATTYQIGQNGAMVHDSTGGAKPKWYLTTDYGVTWTAASVDPGAIDDDLVAITRFPLGNGTRYILGKTAVGAAQGQVFYTDDSGATYTTVSIGGAAAGHGAIYGKSLFAIDRYFVWLASAEGYIYKSTDGGAIWTAKESGTVGTENYNFIHFANKRYGLAAGDADQIVITNNGGDSWAAATSPSSGVNLTCGARIDKNRMWVGTSNGRLYYSNDGGTTWTRRTGFTGDGVGQVRSMQWLDKFTGVIAKNTAGPVGSFMVTYNGGFTWRAYTTPTNAGLNAVWLATQNLMYGVGQPVSSLAFIGKAEATTIAA